MSDPDDPRAEEIAQDRKWAREDEWDRSGREADMQAEREQRREDERW